MISRRSMRLIESILYVFASLAFFYGFYMFLACVKSFTSIQFGFLFPPLLSLALPMYALFIYHLGMYPISFKKAKLTYRVNGYVFAALSLLSLIMISAYLANGTYHGIVQGGQTPLFPLDFLLLDILGILTGAFFVYESYRLQEDKLLYFPYSHKTVRKVFASIGRPLYVLFSAYSLGAFLFGFGMAHYSSPTFMLMIPVYALMLFSNVLLGYYEWGYNVKDPFKENPRKSVLFCWICLGITLFFSLLWLIFSFVDKAFLIENGAAYFPADFQGSMNLAPFVVAFPPFLASLLALINAYRRARVHQ